VRRTCQAEIIGAKHATQKSRGAGTKRLRDENEMTAARLAIGSDETDTQKKHAQNVYVSRPVRIRFVSCFSVSPNVPGHGTQMWRMTK